MLESLRFQWARKRGCHRCPRDHGGQHGAEAGNSHTAGGAPGTFPRPPKGAGRTEERLGREPACGEARKPRAEAPRGGEPADKTESLDYPQWQRERERSPGSNWGQRLKTRGSKCAILSSTATANEENDATAELHPPPETSKPRLPGTVEQRLWKRGLPAGGGLNTPTAKGSLDEDGTRGGQSLGFLFWACRPHQATYSSDTTVSEHFLEGIHPPVAPFLSSNAPHASRPLHPDAAVPSAPSSPYRCFAPRGPLRRCYWLPHLAMFPFRICGPRVTLCVLQSFISLKCSFHESILFPQRNQKSCNMLSIQKLVPCFTLFFCQWISEIWYSVLTTHVRRDAKFAMVKVKYSPIKTRVVFNGKMFHTSGFYLIQENFKFCPTDTLATFQVSRSHMYVLATTLDSTALKNLFVM